MRSKINHFVFLLILLSVSLELSAQFHNSEMLDFDIVHGFSVKNYAKSPVDTTVSSINKENDAIKEYIKKEEFSIALHTAYYTYSCATAAKYEKGKKHARQLIEQIYELQNQQANRITTQTTTSIVLTLVLLSIIALLLRKRTQHQLYVQQIQQEYAIYKQQTQIARMNGLIEGQEQEQKRIAKDLHDDLGADLAIIRQTFSQINTQELSRINQEIFNKAILFLDKATQKLRNISHDLMPTSIKYGNIVDIVEEYVYKYQKAHQLQVDFTYPNELGDDLRLNETQKLNIYRILQQCLQNVSIHANATEVNVSMGKENSTLVMQVADNGRGFDLADALCKPSIGLKTIDSRTNKINGTLQIDSNLNQGTDVIVRIPI